MMHSQDMLIMSGQQHPPETGKLFWYKAGEQQHEAAAGTKPTSMFYCVFVLFSFIFIWFSIGKTVRIKENINKAGTGLLTECDLICFAVTEEQSN